MPDRIDRYLQGAIGRAALDLDERPDADALARVVQDTRELVARRSAPDLSAAILARVGELPPWRVAPRRPSFLQRFGEAFWNTQRLSLRYRPAYAALMVVLLIGVAALSVTRDRALADLAPLAVAAADQRLLVQFRLISEDATEVQLAGSFTNWEPRYRLHQTAPGVWTITLPMQAGVHDYVFLVDGDKWVADPFAPRVEDGFGGVNSRLTLLLPETRRA